MKIAMVILTFMLAISCGAQTAKVVMLSPADAKEAASLYQQKADLEKKIADLQGKIASNYLLCDISGRCINGFTRNFEYSDDFKFIVPAPVQVLTYNGTYGLWNGTGCSYVNPVG